MQPQNFRRSPASHQDRKADSPPEDKGELHREDSYKPHELPLLGGGQHAEVTSGHRDLSNFIVIIVPRWVVSAWCFSVWMILIFFMVFRRRKCGVNVAACAIYRRERFRRDWLCVFITVDECTGTYEWYIMVLPLKNVNLVKL